MISADIWAAVAAVAAAVTAVITLVIARANVSETRTTNQSADFANCLSAVSSLADAQRRVLNADANSAQREFEFRELLNLMETFALLINEDKVTVATKKTTEHFLEEAWAYAHVAPETRSLIVGSVTGTETFKELEKFADKRKHRIGILIRAFEKQYAALSQSPTD